MKVVIIDDSPDDQMLAKAILAKEHLDIVCVDDGRDSLQIVQREKPDLLLLDVDMPGMTGFEICRAIKAQPDLSAIPVIFLSGADSPRDKVTGLDLGAVDYITKPFDMFEFRARIRAALRTKHFQDLLSRYAHIDPVTSLPNRWAMMTRLDEEWARARRHGGNLALILMDVDRFKSVNDLYGHNVGDQLLQEVAQAISSECRVIDLPTRYGGDEFVILVPQEPAADATRLAERCREHIERIRVPAGAREIGATASFGVADATHASSPQDLIEQADKALYEAKKSGRNKVREAASLSTQGARG